MPTFIKLTDNSRRRSRTQSCAMQGYLGYDAGPLGYGYQAKAMALPLATGGYTHDAARPILEHCLAAARDGVEYGLSRPIPDDIVREAITAAQLRYGKVAEVRGLTDRMDETGQLAYLLTEQMVLIEGLTWMLALYVLPNVLAQRRLLSIEQEHVHVIGCTCGAGDGFGSLADHEARDCYGIGWQSRLDMLTEDRASGVGYYEELKTTSYAGQDWQESYENNAQLIAGVDAGESYLRSAGIPHDINLAFVHGLIKGARRKDDYDGMRKQGSSLCYAWVKEANPPLEPGDIQWSYTYVDEAGKNRKLGKGYRKQPIWQVRFEMKPAWMSHAEYWVKSLPPEAVTSSYKALGPIPITTGIAPTFWRNIVTHENAWADKLELLASSPDPWESDRFQDLLTDTIERSWNCYPWNGARCPFVPLCLKQSGWQDPVGSGKFVYRRPHHAPELAQMVERGLVPPGEGWADDEDGESE
jgi:hypothetical protein